MRSSTDNSTTLPTVEDSDDLVFTIAQSVSNAEGTDPTELPPLYDVVDMDALEALFQSRLQHDSATANVATVRFTYCGHEICVTADGDVTLGDE